MRILVTGATGFLGNNLVRMLVEDRHEVVAGVRTSSDRRPLQDLSVEQRELDLNDETSVDEATQSVDVVVHTAAMIHLGWSKIEESRIANVETTRLLASSARRHGVRFIYVSTVDTLAAATRNSVVDETQLEPAKPPCAYVISKREAEQVVLQEVAAGLDGLIVNPGFLVGPWDWKPSSGRMMLMLRKQPLLFFAPGGGGSVVDVRDVADGIIRAIASGRAGERYILGGQNMTYLELWKMMARVMGKWPPPVRAMSNLMAGAIGRVGDGLGFLLRRELEINSASLIQGQLYNWYSSQKAHDELGFQITNVEDAIRDSWEWFQTNGYV